MFGRVTAPAKRKGDAAELEAARLLSDLTGHHVERKLGAGRREDQGDLAGLPDTVMQVAYRPSDTLRVVREKPLGAEVQRLHAHASYAATMVRMRGGMWRVVMTPEQFAALHAAALKAGAAQL
jgi:hypothetical protein